jgi:hypothetical protein
VQQDHCCEYSADETTSVPSPAAEWIFVFYTMSNHPVTSTDVLSQGIKRLEREVFITHLHLVPKLRIHLFSHISTIA